MEGVQGGAGHVPPRLPLPPLWAGTEHKNDYWSQAAMQTECTNYGAIWDLWQGDNTQEGPAWGLNGTQYEEYMFRDRVLSILQGHDFSASPLFIVFTPHSAHCPLQVPQDQLAKFGWVTDDEQQCSAQTPYIFPGSGPGDYRCRSQYEAMVNTLDGVLGNVTGTIKSAGLWDGTLMVLTSDNGGPLILDESGANNAPLRGGKYR